MEFTCTVFMIYRISTGIGTNYLDKAFALARSACHLPSYPQHLHTVAQPMRHLSPPRNCLVPLLRRCSLVALVQETAVVLVMQCIHLSLLTPLRIHFSSAPVLTCSNSRRVVLTLASAHRRARPPQQQPPQEGLGITLPWTKK